MKLKSFGLAVAMALALTAVVGPSSASASNFFAPQGGATPWSGAREGADHVFNFTGNQSFGCSNVSLFSGLSLESEPEPSSLSFSPELICTFLGQPSTFETGTCKYRFNFAPGTMDIVGCTTPIRWAAAGCVIEVPNQEGLSSVTYSTSSEGGLPVIKATPNLSGITYTREGGGCFGGSTGKFTNGTYKGTWKIKAGAKLSASISGSKAEEKGVFNPIGNGAILCSEHVLSAKSSVAKFASMAVTPAYGKCSFLGQPATMSMGGCSYVLHASGAFEIVGASCASSPITFTAAGCTVTIGPQKGTGLTYTNVGSGETSSVTTGGQAKGLTSTAKGAGCITTGTLATDYRAVDSFKAPGGLSVE